MEHLTYFHGERRPTMNANKLAILLLPVIMLVTALDAAAQSTVNDTIRLGAVTEGSNVFPMVFLPEFSLASQFMDPAERTRRNKLRNDVFVVYPYALTAAAILKEMNDNLNTLDGRRDRKKYLRSMDKRLDKTFKEPLKNMSIDQGHVLIKLIDRQSGQNCYSIIKELKGGLSAVVWETVGVCFNNNLNRDYDPDGRDKEIESIVKELEASNAYRYQIYQQQALLRKVKP